MARTIALILPLFLTCAVARADDKPASMKGPVEIAPVPGVVFDLPMGWIACDDATNKRLGEAADPRQLKSSVCAPQAGVPFKFRAFNPLLFRTVSMLIDQHEKQDISAADLANLTPDIVKAMTPQVCTEVVKPMTGDGTVIDSCVVEIGTFAGHPCLHSIIVSTPPDSDGMKFQIDLYEMPYAKGYLQVQFNRPISYLTTTTPETDAISASFRID